MNKFFTINESQVKGYDFVVYATMGENVLDYLEDVEKDLSNRVTATNKSRILFDMLLFANNTPDRFIHADYTNGAFVVDSFEFITVPKNDKIRKLSLNFFNAHTKHIEKSDVLTSAQKKMLLKGIPI